MDTPFNELCKRLYRFPPNTGQVNPISNMYSNEGLFIVEGKMWTSVIQYLYFKKFMFDDEHANIVMNTHDVKVLLKNFGGDLIPQKQKLWVIMRDSVLKRAIYAKFEQNIQLYNILINLSDSAINSITDDLLIDGQLYSFETDTARLLLEVKEYFINNGHPLIDTKSGEYKSKIKDVMKKYQYPVPR
jgi:predicted NAD-dependent protein-ADP-ribosyltransferase YbiA (DUF1768 family)